jgi:hypothetical protein
MGRKKIDVEKKKQVFTLNMSPELFERLESLQIKNKSKFFSWLLEEHFNSLEKKGGQNV